MDMMNAQPEAKAGKFEKFRIRIAGADERLLALCPERDREIVLALANLILSVWLYQTLIVSLISERLFGAPGEIHPELIIGSAFICSIVLQFDSFSIMRTAWVLEGIKFLKRGGIDISEGIGARIKFGIFLCIRIFLSIGIAQLSAIFLSLLIFSADIDSRLHESNLNANAALTSSATALVDGGIQRATAAVNAESTQETALATQVSQLRDNQIDPASGDTQVQMAQQAVTQLLAEKSEADSAVQQAETIASAELGGIKSPETSGIAGDGPRRQAALEAVQDAKDQDQQIATALAAAQSRFDALQSQSLARSQTTEQQSNTELPTFQKALAVEDAKLASMKSALLALEEHRDDAIRTAVQSAPGYVPYDGGLLAEITALDEIGHQNARIAAVIILVDVTGFGIELGAVMAKLCSYVPTTYSGLLARSIYMDAVHMVDEMMEELNASSSAAQQEARPIPPLRSRDGGEPSKTRSETQADLFSSAAAPLPETTKRKRGRPRKKPIIH